MTEEANPWWGNEIETLELIWCAAHLHQIIAPPVQPATEDEEETDSIKTGSNISQSAQISKSPTQPEKTEKSEPSLSVYGKTPEIKHQSKQQSQSSEQGRSSPIKVPDPFPLPNPAEIGKALIPLAKLVQGKLANELDIDATVELTAQANGLLIPVYQPPWERWFDIQLLIDCSATMAFWGDLADSVATLFRWQGILKDVRVWQFDTDIPNCPLVRSANGKTRIDIRSLLAPGQARLFVVVTDTLGKAWQSGRAFQELALLGEKHPVSIAHVYPQQLWKRTALQEAIQRPLVASKAGSNNSQLKVAKRLRTKAPLMKFPIFNLSPEHFKTWANYITGSGSNSIQGILVRYPEVIPEETTNNIPASEKNPEENNPEELLGAFIRDSSTEAQELASVLAAVPLIPPVMRLAQHQFLPESRHWHLAEVFFSGLIRKSKLGPDNLEVPERWYEFQPGVRQLILDNSPVGRTAEVHREISLYVEKHYDSARNFQALVPNEKGSISTPNLEQKLFFAEVRGSVFKTWGGEYAERGKQLLQEVDDRQTFIDIEEKLESFPLEDFTSITKQLIVEDLPSEPELITVEVAKLTFTEAFPRLEPMSFTAPCVSFISQEPEHSPLEKFPIRIAQVVKQRNKWIVTYQESEAYRYLEPLNESVSIEMVPIPAGKFIMGSPEDEIGRYERENPQHEVTVTSFFMGRYPVTQAQWRLVAQMPEINRSLEPNPSSFKGELRPVETVNWYDAVEFCQRLSSHTGKNYRLPSEAEWEYSCRAGTSSTFHFGQMITTDVANYGGSSYGNGPSGERRGETTSVNEFNHANNWGLSDMHGNIFEWCEDHWHNNYDNAPADGSAWVTGGNSGQRVRRGGAWDYNPKLCRSAYRNYYTPYFGFNFIGFRLVCVPR